MREENAADEARDRFYVEASTRCSVSHMVAGVSEDGSKPANDLSCIAADAELVCAERVQEVVRGRNCSQPEAGKGIVASRELRFHEVVPVGMEQLVSPLPALTLGGGRAGAEAVGYASGGWEVFEWSYS